MRMKGTARAARRIARASRLPRHLFAVAPLLKRQVQHQSQQPRGPPAAPCRRWRPPLRPLRCSVAAQPPPLRGSPLRGLLGAMRPSHGCSWCAKRQMLGKLITM
jgi:hypothetical protein